MLFWTRHLTAKRLSQLLAAKRPLPQDLDWKKFEVLVWGIGPGAGLDARTLLEAAATREEIPAGVRRTIVEALTNQGSRHRNEFEAEIPWVLEFTLAEARTVLTSSHLEPETKLHYLQRCWNEQLNLLEWERFLLKVDSGDLWEEVREAHEELSRMARQIPDRAVHLTVEMLWRIGLWRDREHGYDIVLDQLLQEDDATVEVYWKLVDDSRRNSWDVTQKYLEAARLLRV